MVSISVQSFLACLLCTVTGQDTASDSVLTPDDDFYCHAQEFASKDSEIGICNAFLKHSLPLLFSQLLLQQFGVSLPATTHCLLKCYASLVKAST